MMIICVSTLTTNTRALLNGVRWYIVLRSEHIYSIDPLPFTFCNQNKTIVQNINAQTRQFCSKKLNSSSSNYRRFVVSVDLIRRGIILSVTAVISCATATQPSARGPLGRSTQQPTDDARITNDGRGLRQRRADRGRMSAAQRPEAGGQTGVARGRHDQGPFAAGHAQLDPKAPGHRKLPHG